MGIQQDRAAKLFEAVVEMSTTAEQEAYLSAACGPDTQLRAEVEELLAHDRAAGSFLDVSDRCQAQATVDQPAISEGPSTMIGPYKLLQPIGEGGMGVVWMAEQELPVRRKVALKIIKPGLDSRQVIARFEAERQALALMDHHSIARVLDGGATQSGRPFFVMELIHGIAITQYCDDNQLTPRERLELFVPVCQAIQHAHQKGIIHRDVKPSNVLVTLYDGKAVPKVIDFGVAKAIEQQLTERTLFTQYGTILGTFEYMSPEQAEMSALGVDTRSDIYSLGVLLYELLTGTTPLEHRRLREASYPEIMRLIREEEPPRPSTRLVSSETLPAVAAARKTEPAKLTKLFRGELDWIAMKALEKDRNRRYETASAFAADVQRYLHDEPVQACPPSQLYRLGKFARRNKTGLTIVGLIVLFVILLGGGGGWMVRDRMASRQALDNEVSHSLQEATNLIEASKWPDALAAVNHAEKLLVAAGRSDFPPLLRELQRDLVCVQRLENVHSRPKTERFFLNQELDEAYVEAFAQEGIDLSALSIPEAGKLIQTRSIRRELGRALDFWSFVRRRSGSERLPDWKQLTEIAEAADPDPWRNQLRQAQRLNDRKALEALADSADIGQLPVETVLLLATALHERGVKQPAIDLLRQACLLHPHNWWSNNQMGRWYLTASPPQYDEAIRYYSASLAVRPRNPYTLSAIGEALLGKKADEEAESLFARAIELEPTNPYLIRDIAWIEGRAGRWDEAVNYFSLVLQLNPSDWGVWDDRGRAYVNLRQYTQAVADFTTSLGLYTDAAWVWFHRGNAYRSLGEHRKAVADYTKALELDPSLAQAWLWRGNSYQDLGQWNKAVVDYTKAMELDPNFYWAHNNRGVMYRNLGQKDKSLVDLTRAIELDPNNASAWHNRGLVHWDLGRHIEALADYSKAIELEPENSSLWFNRGKVYSDMGQLDNTIADYSKAIELKPDFSWAHNNRGGAYRTKGQLDKAFADFGKAIELDPKNAPAWHNRGNVYRQIGELKKAVADYTKALELDPNNAGTRIDRGLAYGDLDQWADAACDLARAVELAPQSARNQNQLAWLLATCPLEKLREPKRAVERAKKAVELAPSEAYCWNTLGIAYYRLHDFQAAITALQKSMELRQGDDGCDWFFLAMAHGQLGHQKEARTWYDKAVLWQEKNAPRDEELKRFRAEAETLLRAKEK